jgi:hypothetical protein
LQFRGDCRKIQALSIATPDSISTALADYRGGVVAHRAYAGNAHAEVDCGKYAQAHEGF